MRVVIWNVNGCRAGLGAVTTALTACAPDVVCLNEITRPHSLEIARRLGMMSTTSARWRHRIANAVLTTGSPARAQRVGLPHPRGAQRRSAVALRWRGVGIVVTHLGLTADERVPQMRRVLSLCDAPAILAGDLNEGPGGAAFALAAAHLRDAAPDAGDTFPADAPRARIDVCFVTPGIAVVSSEVRDLGASDHRALIVVLQAPRAAI